MKKTQRKWVEEQLRATGEITRNQCLKNYISRLGAIMLDLKKDGWDFTTSSREGDYVYTLGERSKPKRQVVEQLSNGNVRITYE